MDSYATRCRLCGTSDNSNNDKWSDLFAVDSEKLLMKITTCTSVKIDKADNLPKRICGGCNTCLQEAYNFRTQCEITDVELRQEIASLESNDWNINSITPPFECEFLAVKGEDIQNPSSDVLSVESLNIKAETNEQITQESEIILTFEDQKLNISSSEFEEHFSVGEDQTAEESFSNGCEDSQRNETQQFECKQCNRKYTSKRGLKTHMDEFHNDNLPHVCDKCGKGFFQPAKLRYHYIRHTETRDHVCGVCSKGFKSKTYMRLHMKTHQTTEESLSNGCENEQIAPLQGHDSQSNETQPFECKQCNRKYTSKRGLKTHMDEFHNDDPPHVCDKCGKGFSQPAKLRYHYIRHTEARDHLCGICSKGFKSKTYLRLHMNTHLPEDQKKPRKKRCQQETCVCPYCGKISNSRGNHTIHMRRHTGDRRYECHVCLKRFTDSGSQKKHMRIHSGEKPFECEFCQKKFAQRYHLTVHIRGVHTKEKPHECSICSKAFSTRGNYRIHLRSHGGLEATSMASEDSSAK